MARTKKKWSDLSPTQQRPVVAAAVVESIATLSVWRDLRKRPASAVRGPKPVWALVALVQPVGPVAYRRLGRR